ncbi:MAG TPA: hypothetical protein PLD02_16390 [Saprospiraceae bacterium]|nr:hypothetical protein [Saprospiraceae bacterium]
MKRKNETDTLNEEIIRSQNKHAHELALLKDQLHTSYESLKPVNLIKSTFKEFASSADTKYDLFDNALSLGIGFVAKKVFVNSSHNRFRRVVGTLLQVAITNVVSKQSDHIKVLGENLINRFLKYRKESNKVIHHNGTS